MKPNRDFITIPELARFGLVPASTLKRLFSRLGVKPCQHVRTGNGLLPLFARSRLPELMETIQKHQGGNLI